MPSSARNLNGLAFLRGLTTEELLDLAEFHHWQHGNVLEEGKDDLGYHEGIAKAALEIVAARNKTRSMVGMGAYQRSREALRERFDAAKRSLSVTDVLFERGVAIPAGHRADRGYKIGCPLGLHNDSTPSFHVYDGDRGWYCYGCHQGGTIIDLIMLMDKLNSPREALDALAVIWWDQRPPMAGIRRA